MHSDICDAMPIIIKGANEHNRVQLETAAQYYERIGNKERAEEIRKQILKYI